MKAATVSTGDIYHNKSAIRTSADGKPLLGLYFCGFFFGGGQTTVTFRTESFPAYSALSPPIPSHLMSPVPPLLGALE